MSKLLPCGHERGSMYGDEIGRERCILCDYEKERIRHQSKALDDVSGKGYRAALDYTQHVAISALATKTTESVMPGEDEAVEIMLEAYVKHKEGIPASECGEAYVDCTRENIRAAYRALTKLTPQAGGSHD